MKMVLHYFKYDLFRWRWLIAALWGGAAVYIVLMWVLSFQTEWDSWGTTVSRSLFWCVVFVGLAAGTLSYLLGKEASASEKEMWNQTRPKNAVGILTSRILLLSLSIVLPLTGAHWLALSVMKFDGGTINAEILNALFTISAAALATSLWGFARPSFRGFIFGVFVSLALAVCFVSQGNGGGIYPQFFTAIILPAQWFKYDVPWGGVFLASILPLLPILFTGRQLSSKRARGWASFAVGCLSVLVGIVSKPAIYWWREKDKLPLETILASAPQKVISASPRGSNESDGSSINMMLDVGRKLTNEENDLLGEGIRLLSWKENHQDDWSPWVDVQLISRFGFGAETRISIEAPHATINDFEDGELRFGVERKVPPARQAMIFNEGSIARGSGWNLEIGTIAKGSFFTQWQGTIRSTTNSRNILRNVSMTRSGVSSVSDHDFENSMVSLPFFYLGFGKADSRFEVPKVYDGSEASFELTVPGYGEPTTQPQVVIFNQFSVRNWGKSPGPPSTLKKTRQTVSPAPSVNVKRPIAKGAPQFGMLLPWGNSSTAGLPEADATEIEVARFLHSLSEDFDGFHQYRGGTRGQKETMATLVANWLPLFLELAVAKQSTLPSVINQALIDGVPENRREELLRKIPEAPLLAAIAFKRGWQSEAKPFLLQTVQQLDGIPEGWDDMVRSYRDPAFHPAMRKSFTMDVPTLQYWESVPDLASDLPVKIQQGVEALTTETFPNSLTNPHVEALLYAGRSEALNFAIKKLGDPKRGKGWPVAALRRWVLTPDLKPLPETMDELLKWVGNAKAEDFQFDGKSYPWIKISTKTNP